MSSTPHTESLVLARRGMPLAQGRVPLTLPSPWLASFAMLPVRPAVHAVLPFEHAALTVEAPLDVFALALSVADAANPVVDRNTSGMVTVLRPGASRPTAATTAANESRSVQRRDSQSSDIYNANSTRASQYLESAPQQPALRVEPMQNVAPIKPAPASPAHSAMPLSDMHAAVLQRAVESPRPTVVARTRAATTGREISTGLVPSNVAPLRNVVEHAGTVKPTERTLAALQPHVTVSRTLGPSATPPSTSRAAHSLTDEKAPQLDKTITRVQPQRAVQSMGAAPARVGGDAGVVPMTTHQVERLVEAARVDTRAVTHRIGTISVVVKSDAPTRAAQPTPAQSGALPTPAESRAPARPTYRNPWSAYFRRSD